MSRRFSRRLDAASRLGASHAWRASDAANDGSVTVRLQPFLGRVQLQLVGTGQSIAASDANLGGMPSIACAGTGSYAATLFGSAPAAITVATVAYLSAANEGLSALTLAGALNSGVSQLLAAGTLRTRKTFVDCGALAAAQPIAVVQVSVVNSTTGTNYVNSYTGSSTAVAGGVAGTVFHVGALDSANTFALAGSWAYTAVFPRALSASEVGAVLRDLGSECGVAIAP